VCKCTERGAPESITDEEGEPYAYECDECGERFLESVKDDASSLYECSNCGSKYTRDNSADGSSHRCPDCGKFGSKLSEMGCPECGNGELVTVQGQ